MLLTNERISVITPNSTATPYSIKATNVIIRADGTTGVICVAMRTATNGATMVTSPTKSPKAAPPDRRWSWRRSRWCESAGR